MTGAPRRDAALRSVRVARGVRARVELQIIRGPRERVVRRHRRYGTFTSPRGFRASGYRR